MNKTIYVLMLSLILICPSISYALVRLKDVSQSGVGSSGNIKIELSGEYDSSKVKTNYESDHLSLIMNDVFVMPVKKVFKTSSSKSSVSKMEASMVPSSKRSGGTVKFTIYFKVPMDIIKKTGTVSSKGKSLTFSYKTSLDKSQVVTETEKQVETETKTEKTIVKEQPVTPVIPETGIQDNGDKSDAKTDLKTLKDEIKDDKEVKEESRLGWIYKFSSFKTLFLKFIKISGLLIGIIVIILLAVFFFKKYSYQSFIPTTSESVITAPSTSLSSSGASIVKIIGRFDLEEDKKLYVIEVFGEKLLIGSSKSSINLISKLSGGDQSASMTEEQEAMMRSRLKEKLRNL